MLLIPSEVRPSIHGLGLLATCYVPKGTLTWVWDDRTEILVDPYVEGPLADFIKTYGYFVPEYGKVVVNLDNSRFMNHSNTPNLVEPESGRMYAARDISAGEELTCDYRGFDAGLLFSGSFLRRSGHASSQ